MWWELRIWNLSNFHIYIQYQLCHSVLHGVPRAENADTSCMSAGPRTGTMLTLTVCHSKANVCWSSKQCVNLPQGKIFPKMYMWGPFSAIFMSIPGTLEIAWCFKVKLSELWYIKKINNPYSMQAHVAEEYFHKQCFGYIMSWLLRHATQAACMKYHYLKA